jgi:sucrose-6-phosphate hydrolase SacC (GH32 family)
MYYSVAPSTNPTAPKGCAVGIAESRDLVEWKKVGEILPEQDCEKNGLTNGKAIVLGGKVHLFYNTYGNGKGDALCHAVSEDGLKFARDPSNPILRAAGAWTSGRDRLRRVRTRRQALADLCHARPDDENADACARDRALGE